MPILSKNLIFTGLFSAAIIGCSGAETPASQSDDIVEVPLNEVPQNISDVVAAMSPDFKMAEVLKKRREGRTYFDVEGELPNGEEIEFDVLMTDAGPKIVEIQRDIAWTAVPKSARKLVRAANTEKQKIVRVIESQQADTDMIIYEIFVEGYPSKPRFEASITGGAPAKLLDTPWKH